MDRAARCAKPTRAGGRHRPGESELSGLNYDQALFSGRAENIRLFRDSVLARLPPGQDLRVVDVGCGTGDMVFALAAHRSDLVLSGLDISTKNVAAASERARASPAGGRPSFAAADYLAWVGGPADAMLAESVLHLIPGSDEALARKLAADLRPGGLLIVTMPDGRLANRLRILLRRAWSLMPAGLDRLAVAVARVAYPPEPPRILEERVGYLRVVPARLFSPAFAARMAGEGLALAESGEWPNPSLFKLHHRLLVWRRMPDEA